MTTISKEPRESFRRRSELGLIALATLLTAFLYILAGFGVASSIPANLLPFLLVVFGLLVLAHLAVRRLAPHSDPVLLPIAGLLNGVGYIFIERISSHLAALQAAWTAVGILAFVLTLVVVKHARDIERYRYSLAVLGLVMLVLPMLPHIGTVIGGARLWVRIGPLSFQPGELAKIALAAFFASILVERAELLTRGTRRIGRFLVLDPRYIAPIVLAWILSLAIFFVENDLGSSFIFFALFVGMLWIATGRGWYLVLGAVLFVAGSYVALEVMGHARTRVATWLNPWKFPETSGYQIIHGWFALAAGGLGGAGIGRSNASSIPEASSDFIFAVIANELGLIGATAILICFLIIVGSGLRIALRCDKPFEKLLAGGLSMIIGVQTFVIVGGITRIIPLTGITLPFVSYGGSSLVANYILLAILLRISSDTEIERSQLDSLRVGAVV